MDMEWKGIHPFVTKGQDEDVDGSTCRHASMEAFPFEDHSFRWNPGKELLFGKDSRKGIDG